MKPETHLMSAVAITKHDIENIRDPYRGTSENLDSTLRLSFA